MEDITENFSSLKEEHHEHLQDKLGNSSEQGNPNAETSDSLESARWDDHDVDDCRTSKHQTPHAEPRSVQCTEDLPEAKLKDIHKSESSCSEDRSHLHDVDAEDIDLPLNAPENRDSENGVHRYKMPTIMWESNPHGTVDEKEFRLKYTSDETTGKKNSSPTGQDEISDTKPLEIAKYLKIPANSKHQIHHCIINVYMLDAAQYPTPVAEKQLNEVQSLQEVYFSELTRLGTYTDYPQDCPFYAVKLAGNGFVWQSELQSIKCVFCSFHMMLPELKQPGVDPIKMHLERSHHCPLIQGGGSGNKPVPLPEDFQNFPQQVSSGNGSSIPTAVASNNSGRKSSPTENTNNNIGRLREASYQPDMATVLPSPVVQQQDAQPDSHTLVADSVPTIEQPHHSAAPIPRNGSNRSSTNASKQNRAESTRTAAPSAESTRSSNSSSPRSSNNSSRSSNNSSRSSRSAASNGNTPAAMKPASQNSNNRSNTSSDAKAEQPKEKKKLTYSDLGIFAEKPKRPDMATMQKRLATFTGKWKESYTQTPKMLADAGMYYAGYADCARCFFCGGGLKNWEAPDNPWIEHARWFPKCGYIRMCKGPMFVEIVQRKNKNKENITLKDVESEIELKKPSADAVEARNPVTVSSGRGTGKESTTTTGAVGVDGTGSWVAGNNLDLDSLEEENENLKSQVTCKICMDEESTVVFLPCGHLVACTHCAIALKTCPLCRSEIKGSVRAHMN